MRDAPGEFGTTIEEASTWNDTRWTEQLQELPTFVAVDSDYDVGLVRCAKENEIVWLISLWVAPGTRGAGVGGALIDAALRWTRSAAVQRVLLDVTEGNQPARALYR